MVEHRPSKSIGAGSSPALRSISRQRMCRLMHAATQKGNSMGIRDHSPSCQRSALAAATNFRNVR